MKPADAVAVIVRETVMEIMVSFAPGKKRVNPIVFGGAVDIVRGAAEGVAERINAKRALIDECNTRGYRKKPGFPEMSEHRSD